MTKVADDQTTLEELKTLVRDFAVARNWDHAHQPKDLAIGLVTEACEFLELFRFRDEAAIASDLADDAARERMADELADALYFILRFAQMNGFDLSRALRGKLNKTARKYPALSN